MNRNAFYIRLRYWQQNLHTNHRDVDREWLYVRVYATEGCVGDWTCHHVAVEMTVDFWAAAT